MSFGRMWLKMLNETALIKVMINIFFFISTFTIFQLLSFTVNSRFSNKLNFPRIQILIFLRKTTQNDHNKLLYKLENDQKNFGCVGSRGYAPASVNC